MYAPSSPSAPRLTFVWATDGIVRRQPGEGRAATEGAPAAALAGVTIEDPAVPACAMAVGVLSVRTSATMTCYTVADHSFTNTAIIAVTDASGTVHIVQASRRIQVIGALAATGLDARREVAAGLVLCLAGAWLVRVSRTTGGRRRR